MTDPSPTEPALALAGLLHRALAEAAGADGRPLAPVTLSLDYGDLAADPAPDAVTARIDRTTRSLVFASGEVSDGAGRLLAAAAGVFRVLPA